MAELMQGSMYEDSLCNQVHPMNQKFFSEKRCEVSIFQDDNVPIHTAWTVQSSFEEHEGELQHLPWPTSDLNNIEPLWSV
jgi:hypothetical protein